MSAGDNTKADGTEGYHILQWGVGSKYAFHVWFLADSTASDLASIGLVLHILGGHGSWHRETDNNLEAAVWVDHSEKTSWVCDGARRVS